MMYRAYDTSIVCSVVRFTACAVVLFIIVYVRSRREIFILLTPRTWYTTKTLSGNLISEITRYFLEMSIQVAVSGPQVFHKREGNHIHVPIQAASLPLGQDL